MCYARRHGKLFEEINKKIQMMEDTDTCSLFAIARLYFKAIMPSSDALRRNKTHCQRAHKSLRKHKCRAAVLDTNILKSFVLYVDLPKNKKSLAIPAHSVFDLGPNRAAQHHPRAIIHPSIARPFKPRWLHYWILCVASAALFDCDWYRSVPVVYTFF